MRRLAAFGLMLMACGGETAAGEDAADEGSVPASWIQVQAQCGYSFRAPPELVAVESQGIDSCIDGWTSPRCTYTGDYGGFSSDLSEYVDQPQYEMARATIDGRTAKLVTAMAVGGSFLAAVNIAEIDPATPGVGLTVSASCGDVNGQQDALRVFSTIELDEPAPAKARSRASKGAKRSRKRD